MEGKQKMDYIIYYIIFTVEYIKIKLIEQD